MTQDIMRRILRDYFGYEVQFVMNVTDVDDKVKLGRKYRDISLIFSNSDHSKSSTILPL